jgi:hypothetical protein
LPLQLLLLLPLLLWCHGLQALLVIMRLGT